MKAILVGSIAEGFALEALIMSEEKAEAMVESVLKRGVWAESLEVKSPDQILGDKAADPDGTFIVAFYSGIGDGFWLCGPFVHSEEAELWADGKCEDYESWSLMEVSE
ncbi:MAG: hypothetical protein AB1704_20885 [Pseudomonadota bacterium]